MTDRDHGERVRAGTAAVQASRARRAQLAAAQRDVAAVHGWPEVISPQDALAAAVSAGVPWAEGLTPGDVHACVYRDDAAADAWMAHDRGIHGLPAHGKVPTEDGRVIGVIDTRAARPSVPGE